MISSRATWATLAVASTLAGVAGHIRMRREAKASAETTFDAQFKAPGSNEFVLPPLPYPKNELEPSISRTTVEFHYEKHHRGYVNKLNELTRGSDLSKLSLEELMMKERQGKVFNLAAQVWNHTFYWNCMRSPKLNTQNGGKPKGHLAKAIDESFGSFENFKKQFSAEALAHFGSGWAWLVRDENTKKLKVISTHDAQNPMLQGYTPLLTLDVWEHAYYLDYRNDRQKYIEQWWDTVNWDFVASRLK